MLTLDRITSDPTIMNGKACIRGMRITVSLVLNLIANGIDKSEILKEYPVLESEDIDQCLRYAAYLAEEGLYSTQRAS
jgi:uncharacterized protein (DUF433 family)